jgi:hypothetical protein
MISVRNAQATHLIAAQVHEGVGKHALARRGPEHVLHQVMDQGKRFVTHIRGAACRVHGAQRCRAIHRGANLSLAHRHTSKPGISRTRHQASAAHVIRHQPHTSSGISRTRHQASAAHVIRHQPDTSSGISRTRHQASAAHVIRHQPCALAQTFGFLRGQNAKISTAHQFLQFTKKSRKRMR